MRRLARSKAARVQWDGAFCVAPWRPKITVLFSARRLWAAINAGFPELYATVSPPITGNCTLKMNQRQTLNTQAFAVRVSLLYFLNSFADAPTQTDLWRALQDHPQTKDLRPAIQLSSTEILDPSLVIAPLGRVTLPLDNAQLAVMKPWFQQLPGDLWQFKALPDCAKRVTTSGEWDAYVARTVRNVAVKLGMPGEEIRHSLCRVMLEEGRDRARLVVVLR